MIEFPRRDFQYAGIVQSMTGVVNIDGNTIPKFVFTIFDGTQHLTFYVALDRAGAMSIPSIVAAAYQSQIPIEVRCFAGEPKMHVDWLQLSKPPKRRWR